MFNESYDENKKLLKICLIKKLPWKRIIIYNKKKKKKKDNNNINSKIIFYG